MQGVDITQELVCALQDTGSARRVAFAPFERLFRSGDACRQFVVILAGTVRIQLASRNGRNVTLFQLQAGQSCALTASCLFRQIDYYAEGVAETDVEALMVPAADFMRVLAGSPQLCSHLLEDFAGRLAGLASLVDRMTVRDMEAEIAGYLLANCSASMVVARSHKAIADEIGTAREVVSRKLKAMERAGRVKLGRGHITILEAETLAGRARANRTQR